MISIFSARKKLKRFTSESVAKILNIREGAPNSMTSFLYLRDTSSSATFDVTTKPDFANPNNFKIVSVNPNT
ncbi:hypothetical protein RHMOL_Rhmol13G0183900 [Rhododendron molle]|uniref:Uncharacterized protein n=1 Tax=Rhododendron molle TaxID=49168 RepID=A0ACC0L840_RHOML|nr:hypothetical protein RHMOL_Rhmol13G0183900 [Rhododendron molle]